MLQGLREAPALPDTVAQSAASAHHSRLDPVVGSGAGVFQAPSPGKYLRVNQLALPDGFSASSLPAAGTSKGFPNSNRSAVAVTVNSNPPGNHLTIYYQNVGGMNTRALDYRLACSANSYDVIVLTETWLGDHTLSAQVFGNGYEVFRCDRQQFINSVKKHGGGVAIAVRRGLRACIVNSNDWKCVEQVWVKIDLADHKLFICALYIPPDLRDDATIFEAHSSSVSAVLSDACPVDDLVVLGDFNLPGLVWRPSRDGFLEPDPVLSSQSPHVTEFLDAYCTATLQQINPFVNERNVTLDLCFVSCPDSAPPISIAPSPLVKDVLHHSPLHLAMALSRDINCRPNTPQVSYDYSKSDIPAILELLHSIDWEATLDKDNIDAAVQTFSNILGYAIDRHVPKKSILNNRIPWQTSELRRLKASKRSALKKYSIHRTLPLRNHYLRLNQCYKTMSKRCYASYELKTQQKLKSNPKAFWKHINEQRKEFGLPSSMFLNNETGTSPDAICRLLASKFSSMFVQEDLSPQQVMVAASKVPPNGLVLDRIAIDDTNILDAASKLKSSISTGPDGIPSLILKKCIAELLVPFRHLFTLSIASGTFPDIWKHAYMFPVHKKGDKRNLDNYRGISTLCAASKLFELVVMAPIFFFCKNLVSDDQHGFMPGRSTTTNLLSFTTFVTDGFIARSQTDAIYTDLSAAFDKINHLIAVAKLERMGINGCLLRWFHSYLTGRSINVKVGDCLSAAFEAFSGIPQGSHLGPLVFLFYYNDCNHSLSVPRLSYADDMKIFSRVDTARDARTLQQQLDIFADWCDINRMVLNPLKCSVITFTRKANPVNFEYRLCGIPVSREKCVKDLGVLLDTELTYKQHISHIITKASRQLGFVFRATKNFTDVYCLKSLYCALVRSTLEYCSAVWNPYYGNSTARIESVQRRFIRFALRHLPWRDPLRLPSYESRCQLIHLDTLDVRRNVSRALVVADLLTSRIYCPALLRGLNILAPIRTLRNSAFFSLPVRRSNYGMHSALIGLQRIFNAVFSVFDFNLSRDVIKNKFFMLLRR